MSRTVRPTRKRKRVTKQRQRPGSAVVWAARPAAMYGRTAGTRADGGAGLQVYRQRMFGGFLCAWLLLAMRFMSAAVIATAPPLSRVATVYRWVT